MTDFVPLLFGIGLVRLSDAIPQKLLVGIYTSVLTGMARE